jgi:hypothetical protein
MKKILILMLAVLSVGTLSGQENKKKVAVYTVDASEQNIVEFVGDYVTNAIVKRGVYIAIERTAQFLEELGKEQGFQRSGAVDDGQISKIGRNMGVDYVCAVKVAVSGVQGAQKEHFITSRLIDVETAELAASSRPTRIDVNDWNAIEKSCENVTASLFGERGSSNRSDGSTFVYVDCQFEQKGGIHDVFAGDPGILCDIVKSAISENDCNVTDNRDEADYELTLIASTTQRSGGSGQFSLISYYANVRGNLYNRLTGKKTLDFAFLNDPEAYATGATPEAAATKAFKLPKLKEKLMDKILTKIKL